MTEDGTSSTFSSVAEQLTEHDRAALKAAVAAAGPEQEQAMQDFLRFVLTCEVFHPQPKKEQPQ